LVPQSNRRAAVFICLDSFCCKTYRFVTIPAVQTTGDRQQASALNMGSNISTWSAKNAQTYVTGRRSWKCISTLPYFLVQNCN